MKGLKFNFVQRALDRYTNRYCKAFHEEFCVMTRVGVHSFLSDF